MFFILLRCSLHTEHLTGFNFELTGCQYVGSANMLSAVSSIHGIDNSLAFSSPTACVASTSTPSASCPSRIATTSHINEPIRSSCRADENAFFGRFRLNCELQQSQLHFIDMRELFSVAACSSIVWAMSIFACLLYTSPSPRDRTRSRMPSSA